MSKKNIYDYSWNDLTICKAVWGRYKSKLSAWRGLKQAIKCNLDSLRDQVTDLEKALEEVNKKILKEKKRK